MMLFSLFLFIFSAAFIFEIPDRTFLNRIMSNYALVIYRQPTSNFITILDVSDGK